MVKSKANKNKPVSKWRNLLIKDVRIYFLVHEIYFINIKNKHVSISRHLPCKKYNACLRLKIKVNGKSDWTHIRSFGSSLQSTE